MELGAVNRLADVAGVTRFQVIRDFKACSGWADARCVVMEPGGCASAMSR